MWMGPISPLAVKLMAFGKCAFVQSGKGSTHTGVNGRSSRPDNDADLIVVTVAEPVEGHQSLTDYKARHTRTAPTHTASRMVGVSSSSSMPRRREANPSRRIF